VTALTEGEAGDRARLIEVESYDVFLDLTADPVRSRSEVRFRCREPGAGTFADLTATTVLGAVLNGWELGPPVEGRLGLPGLDLSNVLVVEAEVGYSGSGRGLSRFTDPQDGAGYLAAMCYPTHAPSVFCCFDQLDMVATMTLGLVLPPGFEGVSLGAVLGRPAPGEAGLWRFGPVRGTPCELTFAAGPYVRDWEGSAGTEGVKLSLWRRGSLGGAAGVADIARWGEVARQALERYEQILGVPCPDPKYDIAFVPDLTALAVSIPGLMMVNESLLARLSDPRDDVVPMVCAHEVAHLWFGGVVSMRWWDDVWLDEAMATYMSYTAGIEGFGEPWTAFCYRDEPRAYLADELPGREPVASRVANAAEALLRPSGLTYCKGAAAVRQLAALIGDDALRAGLGEYMREFGGRRVADLEDLVGCWSRAAGRDLAEWAQEWLRSEGASVLLAAAVTSSDRSRLDSVTVRQEDPRTHRIDLGLYGWSDGRLSRLQVIGAEVSGPLTEVRVDGLAAGTPVPDVVVPNVGDLTYAHVEFDEPSLRGLARAAMDVGDPLTEAVCWNAAWRMVLRGTLAAADFAGLVLRRLGGVAPVLPVAVEVLLDRAVSCADVYTQVSGRGVLRERIAAGVLSAIDQPGAPGERMFAAAFAACAQSDEQLSLLRSWLRGGSLPSGLAVDAELRNRMLMTLSARGLASEDDLEAMAAGDPVAGRQNAATCRAMRPEAVAKEAAWTAALSESVDWPLALASARGVWVPGQEALMGGYAERYFTEALPAIDGREVRVMRNLARTLYPATLPEASALVEASAGTEALDGLSRALRVVVEEREEMARWVLAARAAERRADWPG